MIKLNINNFIIAKVKAGLSAEEVSKKAYIKQVAIELGLAEYELGRKAKEGKMSSLKSGVRYIFDIELCEEFLRNQAIESVAEVEGPIQYVALQKINAN